MSQNQNWLIIHSSHCVGKHLRVTWLVQSEMRVPTGGALKATISVVSDGVEAAQCQPLTRAGASGFSKCDSLLRAETGQGRVSHLGSWLSIQPLAPLENLMQLVWVGLGHVSI